VRWLFFYLFWVTAIGFLPATAQDTIVQEFSGSGTTTTGLFKVQDRWEVRWNARQVVSVAVMSADGTIVAGAAGVLRGSLFVPLGGQYYLKISDGTVYPPAPATNAAPAAITNAAPAAGTKAAPAAVTNAAPTASTNAAPVAITNAPAASTNAAPVAITNAPAASPSPVATDISSPPPPEPVISWHLQIMQLGTSVASDQALTVYTPFFMVPDSAVTPGASASDLPPPVLTSEQAQAVVTIKGDNAQGAGFLMRSPEGTFVVTQLHLLAANPNVKIFTNSGEQITTLSLKGAVDRDLALFTVQDNHYSYLPFSTDAANSVQAGDQLIIPDIRQQTVPDTSPQTDGPAGKPGKVIRMGPERIDFDNAMGPGNSGAPVIHVKTGSVLALVAAEKKVDVSNDLAQAWPANPAPGSADIIPYFGLRLDGAQGWETYDWPRFLAETLFLKQFHQDTRCLDSYLNGRRRHRAQSNGEDNGPPDTKYFLNNPKLREANDTYKQTASGADRDQRLDAARELLFDLQGIADTDMSTLQEMNNLYAFDQTWAQEEVAYRKALKKELDGLGDNLLELENIALFR
jgi:hypothetical protein